MSGNPPSPLPALVYAQPGADKLNSGTGAIAIMLGTIVIKGMCWLWCRLVKNSSVQAL